MRKTISVLSFAVTFIVFPTVAQSPHINAGTGLQAGAAAVKITPYGSNPDWKRPITESGVWGEKFVDANHNGRWDEGEPFTADPGNAQIDPKSANRYAGIYLAGFGDNRMATGMHDDLWARALVVESGTTKIAIVSLDLIGYTQDGGYFGLEFAKKWVDPNLGIQEVLLTCTHDHEGPDTIGACGRHTLGVPAPLKA